MKLTASNVEDTLVNLLFKEGEDTSTAVIVRGVMMHIGFHPERLQEQKENIISMLEQLPETFREKSGGGWSFLNACQDKDENQWADLHETMDKLVCLGLAIRRVAFVMPREMWAMFPGGMPYFVVLEKDAPDPEPAKETEPAIAE